MIFDGLLESIQSPKSMRSMWPTDCLLPGLIDEVRSWPEPVSHRTIADDPFRCQVVIGSVIN